MTYTAGDWSGLWIFGFCFAAMALMAWRMREDPLWARGAMALIIIAAGVGAWMDARSNWVRVDDDRLVWHTQSLLWLDEYSYLYINQIRTVILTDPSFFTPRSERGVWRIRVSSGDVVRPAMNRAWRTHEAEILSALKAKGIAVEYRPPD
jgi:hypothetical protein